MIGTVCASLLLLVALGASVLVLAYYVRTGVPPIPVSRSEAEDVIALLREASLPEHAKIYELGCGFGALAVALARAFPNARVEGIELSPLPWLVARVRALWLRNLRVRRGDFFACALADADAVTAYLMMKPMRPLANALDATLRRGAAVVCVTFWFRDRQPWRVRRGRGLRGDVALYRWPGVGTPDALGPAKN